MVRGVATRIRVGSFALMYIGALVFGILPLPIAKADALLAYGGTDLTGLVEDEIDLSGITISGSDPVVPVTLDISDSGGILYMTDTTGLTFSGDDRGSRISFSGSVADLNNALATLRYRTLSAGTWTLNAMVLDPGIVYNPTNGHMYEVVNYGESHSWDEAKPAAEARTLNGASGYLATITSQEENDYLQNRLEGDGWFGASDAETEDDWKWVTGPDAGTSFWLGDETGAAVSGRYSNWADSEPNDSGDMEDCAQFYSSGNGWNDLPCNTDQLDYYVTEYGGPGDMPTAPEMATFDITVSEPSNDVIPIATCLDILDVADNDEIDNRYDTLSLTANVDCTGETLTPMFDDVDMDFNEIGFRGTLDGNGYAIDGLDIDGTGMNESGLFARFNEADVIDLTLSGGVAGDYCVGGLVGTAVNSSLSNITSTVDVQGYSEVGGIVGCYEGENAGTGSMSDLNVDTSINATEGDSGGVIGDVDMEESSELDLSQITVDVSFVDTSDNRFGGVIGDANSSEESVMSLSDIVVESGINIPNSSSVGGIGGEIEAEDNAYVIIEDITVSGEIVGNEYVGGLVGEVYGSASSSPYRFSVNNVSTNNNVTGYYNVGGYFGYAYAVHIANSRYSGTVVGEDYSIGGFIGEAYDSEITESYTIGEVAAADSFIDYGGGLVGYAEDVEIVRSFSTMDITSTTGEELGGLAGYAYESSITDSYARGNITGYTTEGGLIGYCENSTVVNTYSTGSADGETRGGLIGDQIDCAVENSFWDTQTSLNATSTGDETGKLTTEMKDVATYLDIATEGLDEVWDFETVWGIAALVNNGYPCLQWQDEDCAAAELEEEPTVEDDDTDGVTSAVEDAAPNSGDANNDGTPDADQNFVSSFVNPVTTAYIAIEVSDACALSSVSAEDEAVKTVKDSGYDYSTGLVNFTANCGTPGYRTTVKIFAYNVSPSGLVLRKHNPVTNAYFSIDDAAITQVVIDGQNVVVATYEIVDGGVLDTDGQQNGVIVDPVGLASLVVSVPNTGFRR